VKAGFSEETSCSIACWEALATPGRWRCGVGGGASVAKVLVLLVVVWCGLDAVGRCMGCVSRGVVQYKKSAQPGGFALACARARKSDGDTQKPGRLEQRLRALPRPIAAEMSITYAFNTNLTHRQEPSGLQTGRRGGVASWRGFAITRDDRWGHRACSGFYRVSICVFYLLDDRSMNGRERRAKLKGVQYLSVGSSNAAPPWERFWQ